MSVRCFLFFIYLLMLGIRKLFSTKQCSIVHRVWNVLDDDVKKTNENKWVFVQIFVFF